MKIVIFGCGNIAKRIAKSLKLCNNVDFVGFASRDTEKAKEYAKDFDVELYGDYDYFLNSDIDAVYIATYNINHYELIKKCLEHQKSVICEKPMLASVKEIDELFELAKQNNVTLMEALKSVFLPINIKVKELIDNKTIGDVITVSAGFMRNGSHSKDHWINDVRTGGALKDLGTYCIGTINFLMGKAPKLVELESDKTDKYADSTAYVKLDYDGVSANVSVSNAIDGSCDLKVVGTKGKIVVHNFWKAGDGVLEIDSTKQELKEELISDFYYELEHFAYLVDNHILESNIMNKEASKNIVMITE